VRVEQKAGMEFKRVEMRGFGGLRGFKRPCLAVSE
jgi:hypothetical protein